MQDAESSCKLNATIPSKECKEAEDTSVENFRNVKIYSHLNFLLIALKTGEIQVHVFGLFCCGVVNVKQHLPEGSGCTILSTDIAQNLKSLTVVANVLYNSTNTLCCVVIDTELHDRAQDLYTISYVRGSILNTINNINRAMVSIIEAHEHIVIEEMQMQIFEYSKGKEDGTLSTEFMELLLFGFYSSELANFLLSELSDKKLKKISSSIDVSHSNILKQIVNHLRPSIEKLLFELTIMLGLARLSRIFSETRIVMDESLINNCTAAAGAFNMKANKVLHILEDSSIKYKSFFRWLTNVGCIITNDRSGTNLSDISQREMNLICDYLCEIDSSIPISEKDELGQYLADKDVTLKSERETKNQWRMFLSENPCLEEYELMIPRIFQTKSLVQTHKYLTDAVDLIFKNFTEYLRNDFPARYSYDLLSSGQNATEKVSLIEVPKSDKILISYIRYEGGDKFLDIVDISCTSADKKIASIYFEESNCDKFELIDFQFYTPEVISILLEKHECLHSFCVQLAVDCIQNFYCNPQPQNVFSVLDRDCLKTIENMKSLKFAVSGPRKVSVIVAEDGHRVRIFEMEADDEDESAMNTTNLSNEEASGNSKLAGSEFSEDDFMNSTYDHGEGKCDASGNVADDSDDRIHLESSIVEFGDIDVNTLSMLSDFTDIDDLMLRHNVSSLDAELERDIASLVIHSDNSQSASSNFNEMMNENDMLTNFSSSNMDIAEKANEKK
jgi:anaphase-promoting complex subunit 4